ncbi:MAG: tetratricopeptide repeat protein [Dehalococcoidales bacterium]|nr:MAG: tetratricopeptide repeat protein [Dehalococcoidales bacterium]
MTYQDSEQARLRRQSSKQAVALAMEGRWKEAVEVNKSLLENFPNDVDAYNRLGRAHMELGEYTRAREAYKKALEIDSYNTIAKRNLQRLSLLGESGTTSEANFQRVDPQSFIEEVGKAGVVSLVRLAQPQVLAKAVDGSRASLRVKGPMLTVENNFGEYLGQVEPKHGQRLIKLMEGGNRYSAAIISSTEEAVSIIIKEVYQDPSQAGKLSFPPKGSDTTRPSADDRIDDRMIRRQLEEEESASEESGYAIVGGDIDLSESDTDDVDGDGD